MYQVTLSKSQRRRRNKKIRNVSTMVSTNGGPMILSSFPPQPLPNKFSNLVQPSVVQVLPRNQTINLPRKRVKRNRNRSQRTDRLSYLKGSYVSSYLKSLLDPWALSGVKIPDGITYPSATCQLRKFITLAPASIGSCGVALCSAIPNGAIDYIGCQSIYAFHSTIDGNYNWTGWSFQGQTSFVGAADSYRVVSAGIRAFYTGSQNNRAGLFVTGLIPREEPIGGTEFPSVNLPNNDENAYDRVNTNKCSMFENGGSCIALWRPQDNADFEYHSLSQNIDGGTPPSVYVVATGLVSGSSISFEVVMNIEYVPSSDFQGLVKTSPSVSDSKLMDQASTVLGQTTSSMKTVMIEELKEAASIGVDYLTRQATNSLVNMATNQMAQLEL